MVHELLSFEFDPQEIEQTGMSEERYLRALEASKFMARVVKTAGQIKVPNLHQSITDRFVVVESVRKTKQKIDTIANDALRQPRVRTHKRPHTRLLSLDIDSFDELFHYRSDGELPRKQLVERGYDTEKITDVSWDDVHSLDSWHKLHDVHKEYAPQFVNNDRRMIAYVAERAGIQPVLQQTEVS